VIEQPLRSPLKADPEPAKLLPAPDTFADPTLEDRQLFPPVPRPKAARSLLPATARVTLDTDWLVKLHHSTGLPSAVSTPPVLQAEDVPRRRCDTVLPDAQRGGSFELTGGDR